MALMFAIPSPSGNSIVEVRLVGSERVQITHIIIRQALVAMIVELARVAENHTFRKRRQEDLSSDSTGEFTIAVQRQRRLRGKAPTTLRRKLCQRGARRART